MKSGAEPRTSVLVRGSGLFDRVDYRLVETPQERDSIYLLRYRAYLHGGLISPSESRRVTDCYDDAMGLEIRRAPSFTRLSRTVLDGRADNSQRLIETDRTADPLTVRGDRRGCRPIHTDRRGEVCGNRGATIVRPVGREGRAWRDCSSSRGWRSWWRTLAKSGCSTWTQHGCSRHRRCRAQSAPRLRFGTRAGGRR